MRNMSFMLTTRQMHEGTKTVTRRLGWKFLKPGDRFQAVEKCQGLKPGEKVVPICICEVVSVRREPLNDITNEDVVREGFGPAPWKPGLEWFDFVEMFCHEMKCAPDTIVTRIEFKQVGKPPHGAEE